MSELNVTFSYLYRDGGNCKQVGAVVFRNPDMLGIEEIAERIMASLDDEQWFIADQINVPEAFLFPRYEVNENDHCWHEFSDVYTTQDEPTDKRTIAEFLADVERAAASGWKVFDPIQREALRASLTKSPETAKEEAAA